MNIVFFGSTTDSVLVLHTLTGVVAVVTQPPKPVGRYKIITPTPVEIWATSHTIPVTTLDAVTPFKPDLLVSASYGEKIPIELITKTPHGGLNVHPSLLPRWRGADPVPWAILSGDHQIGVTVVTLSEKFDQGEIIAQKKIPILTTDVSPRLRTQLFQIGADLLIDAINKNKFRGTHQDVTGQPYAKRLTRDDGFEQWENIINPTEAERINRKFRAFHPWPGLWTKFGEKRLKILEFTHTPITVQLEGKNPIPFSQFKSAYLSS